MMLAAMNVIRRYVTESEMNDASNNSATVTIEALAHELAVRARRADDDLIAAALLFRELRARIVRGELGSGVKWMEWMRKNVKLSESRLYEVMRVADADDSLQELEHGRRLNRARQKAWRERKKTEKKAALEPDRAEIIAWAKIAAMADIRKIGKRIGALKKRPASPRPPELSSGPNLEKSHPGSSIH